MSPKKIERLIMTLRAQDVEYIKTPEIEIRLREHAGAVSVERKAPPEKVFQKEATAAAAPPAQMEIPHHENQVAKLLKLSDEDLVDRLFPDYTQQVGNG